MMMMEEIIIMVIMLMMMMMMMMIVVRKLVKAELFLYSPRNKVFEQKFVQQFVQVYDVGEPGLRLVIASFHFARRQNCQRAELPHSKKWQNVF